MKTPIGRHLACLLAVGISCCCAMEAAAGEPGPQRPAAGPAPRGWFAGDPHVHRGKCCGNTNAGRMATPEELLRMMEVNDLAVVSMLDDIGNGECRESPHDFNLVTGRDHPASKRGRILHWDAEWHCDPKGVTFEEKAIGGHLILLGLKSAEKIYREYTHPIIEWAQEQGAIAGFAHMQYLGDDVPTQLDCCSPLEYPVEVALAPGVFLMEDVRGADNAMKAYYRLLNCGFRPGIAAGTDYPCYAGAPVPLGDLVTYVHVPDGKLTYRKWIEGIAAGRTVVSRNARNEFLGLMVNGVVPGGEIRFTRPGRADVEVVWSASQRYAGAIEIVHNGVVVASRDASAGPGNPSRMAASIEFRRSGWVCARRVGPGGHQSHTAAVFVTVDNQPVRASAADADFFVRFIDNLLIKTAPDGEWGAYLKTSHAAAHSRYRAAKAIYRRIATEARAAAKE